MRSANSYYAARKSLIISFCIFLCCRALSQVAPADSTIYNMAVQHAIAQYRQVAGMNAGLYNGPAYLRYDHGMTGHPYFLDDSFSAGALSYDGLNWDNLPLLYDLVQDKVVIEYKGSGNLMELVSGKVNWFRLKGHEFLFIDSSLETAKARMATGFYGQPYAGRHCAVFVKWKKRIRVPANTSMPPYFVEEKFFYIRNGNNYFPVNGKKDLLLAFEDRKKEISNQMKKQSQKFKRDKESYIRMIAAYYEQLKG